MILKSWKSHTCCVLEKPLIKPIFLSDVGKNPKIETCFFYGATARYYGKKIIEVFFLWILDTISQNYGLQKRGFVELTLASSRITNREFIFVILAP